MIRLFVQTYNSKNNLRQAELEECLKANRELLEVVTFDNQERLTFGEMFSRANEFIEEGDISIFANSDIKFDETIFKAAPDVEECYCLTRWDNGRPIGVGADAWIFNGKVKTITANFGMGIANCDYAISAILYEAGYKLSNPALDIIATHVHKSNIRTYYKLPKVPKPHIYTIPMSHLGEEQELVKVYTFYSDTHKFLVDEYLRPSIPSEYELIAVEKSQKCPSGTYLKEGWANCMADKLDVLIEACKIGKPFIFLDADVKICDPIALQWMMLELGDDDIAFQRDRVQACAGVFACQGNKACLDLFTEARKQIKTCDQPIINKLLPMVKHKMLSNKFWNFSMYRARTWDGKENFLIPQDALLVHANWCIGVENKVKILEKAKVWNMLE